MKTIEVQLDQRSYFIFLDDNWETLFHEGFSVGRMGKLSGKKLLLITDENVATWYLQPVKAHFQTLGFAVTTAVVAQGESSKSLQEAEKLYAKALNANLDRHSLIVALGGGVIGDLAGFVASTYMRGIPYIQIPTSLLAQVDSSIGGKVAVNHSLAKNVIGSFYQPKGVLMNASVLKTLPKRELSTGMAELIKHGIIRDEAFFTWLECNIQAMMAQDLSTQIHAIHRSCQIKADVVAQDEREQGLRAILNFGHTVGHAVEAASGYGTLTHGEAVSIGMIVETRIACLMGLVSSEYEKRIESLLIAAGLPVTMPYLDPALLLEWMQRDKKNVQNRIVFVLPTAPGKVEVFHDIKTEAILEALDVAWK